jgi:hypothetical protein
MNEIIEQRDGKGRFLSGTKPGPGRKLGSRNAIATDFLKAIQADFEEHGLEAVERCRRENAPIYLKIVADLLPKEASDKIAGTDGLFRACESLNQVVQALLSELSLDESLAMCDELKAALLLHASDQARPIG